MASKDTIKHVLHLFRSVTDFPMVAAKKDPDTGVMIQPGTVEAWMLALVDLTDEQVMAGGQFVLSSMTDDFKRRPMPGDIRKALSESASKGWAEAWDEIQARGHRFLPGGRRLTSRGLEPAPQWSSPEIAAAVSQMGGVEACLLHTDRTLSAVRSQFRDVYHSVQKRTAFQQCKALPQPPQVPALSVPPLPALPAAAGGEVIDFLARREQLDRVVRAQQQAGAQLVRDKLKAVEAKRLAEYQAKIAAGQQQAREQQAHREAVEARAEEQKRQAREMAAAEGIDLDAPALPEVGA